MPHGQVKPHGYGCNRFNSYAFSLTCNCNPNMLERTRAGTNASWLLPIGSQTVQRLRAADRGTRAVAVGIASGSDVNGKLRSSRIRNALGLELIRWTRAGTPCRNKRRDQG
ncbi:hypothetical protein F2Q69_00036686 [Brassica cretica]|uniref:Uncharacterized protein n=1 Tax=Brassica cretica TaxID=69181 RepID=A0A8S9SKR2_BRACR|nr:hypothetical protein F2Q69_00036686 [Brassica cretica]